MSNSSSGKKTVPGGDVFIIDVKFRQNATWQGSVKCPPSGKMLNFRSELELIKIMDSVLEHNHPEDKAQDS